MLVRQGLSGASEKDHRQQFVLEIVTIYGQRPPENVQGEEGRRSVIHAFAMFIHQAHLHHPLQFMVFKESMSFN